VQLWAARGSASRGTVRLIKDSGKGGEGSRLRCSDPESPVSMLNLLREGLRVPSEVQGVQRGEAEDALWEGEARTFWRDTTAHSTLSDGRSPSVSGKEPVRVVNEEALELDEARDGVWELRRPMSREMPAVRRPLRVLKKASSPASEGSR